MALAYFAKISDSRRFAVDGELEVFAVYDSCRAYTLYAPVGISDDDKPCFAGEPRVYFDDEVCEI